MTASLGRLGTADEVAAAALFVTSDKASYGSGHILAVAGGHVAALTVCSPDSALLRISHGPRLYLEIPDGSALNYVRQFGLTQKPIRGGAHVR